MIRKFYADLADGHQTHYRRAGAGSPLVLLHASPMSSALMVPLIERLSDMADVIAPDTPGYGQSDPLAQEQLKAAVDLTPYVNWLAKFINTMELQTVGVYGTATGAQIAIEFARRFPDRVQYVVLDNAAHFTDDERDAITRDYFPSIAPEADGSHLQQAWEMARGVFQWFPWYRQDDAHRISDQAPPAAAVHATAMAYLIAGEDYAEAYRRAFNNEDASRVLDIEVPVRVIRWQGSVLKHYADRYDDFDWPPHIQMVRCEADVAERYAAIRRVVKEFAE